MAAEKKGSKGRFLYLFDWNAKSRKKLFSNKSESSGGSKQGKENLDSSAVSPFFPREAHFGDGYNHSCASSINGDDSYGSKAPGVVARLMGLESLPTSGGETSISSHYYESDAVGSSYYPEDASGYPHDHRSLDCGYMANKLEEYHWNSMDSRSNMVRGRPIERFQNEVLPPKSAKPISITHHKLLSPIKSPGFIPTKNAAYIMEAAARIIDPAPQETFLMRTPSFGSSSTPLRIRDLKDRMEAAHRSAILSESSKKTRQSPSTKHLRGNSHDRLVDKPSSRRLDLETRGVSSSTKKGKSVSPAVHGKDNAHRKDISASNNSRKMVRREHKQVKLKQSSNSQPSAKRSDQTRDSTNKSSGVLRQNTEKQNCMSNKDKGTSKYSIPNQQHRRSIPIDGSSGSSKRVNKVLVSSENGSKKVSSATLITEKRPSLHRMKNISRNKELLIKDRQIGENIAGDRLAKKNERAMQHDVGRLTAVDNKKSMDVISFTFNSPIKKSGSVSRSSNEMTRSSGLLGSKSHDIDDQPDSQNSSSPLLKLKLIGTDALSLLLEQKLKELTDKVELNQSQSDSGKEGNDTDSVSDWSELVSRRTAVQANSTGLSERLHKHDQDVAYDGATKREEIEGECSSSNANKFYTREGLQLGHINTFVPDCSFSSGSCISSNSRSDCTYGNGHAFLLQSEEEISYTSTEKFHSIEDERDISDTASSYYEEWDGKHTSTSQSVSEFYVDNWELQYVRQIVHFAGLEVIVLDANNKIIDSCVFDHVENHIINSTINVEECTKLRRKLLFDCLNDCLCLRYEQISLGSYKAWSRWRVLLQKEDWLVEELYKEVLGLEDMGNLMVDELVEKDMGTQHSGWLAFEIETLEEGMEIENDIVDCLIDELVVDLSSF